MAMNMAIEEAKAEFQALRANQYVQQCSIGVDRTNTCLIAWQDATKVLDASFVRRSVAGICVLAGVAALAAYRPTPADRDAPVRQLIIGAADSLDGALVAPVTLRCCRRSLPANRSCTPFRAPCTHIAAQQKRP